MKFNIRSITQNGETYSIGEPVRHIRNESIVVIKKFIPTYKNKSILFEVEGKDRRSTRALNLHRKLTPEP